MMVLEAPTEQQIENRQGATAPARTVAKLHPPHPVGWPDLVVRFTAQLSMDPDSSVRNDINTAAAKHAAAMSSPMLFTLSVLVSPL